MADIKNVKSGNNQVNKIYVGDNISWIYEAPDITAPVTTPYPTSAASYNPGREIYFEVNETCFTYYTLDGSPVSEASTLYTAPIVLNATTTINYFSIDLAGNAETPKTVTYTIAALTPAKPVVTTIAGNWYVRVNWTATANTDSYNVYRSTAAGVLGETLSTAQTGVGFDDNNPINNTTYYYTVRANNVSGYTDSDQVTATPAAPAPSGWRYLKILGYGATAAGQEATTRMIEAEAYIDATTNVLAGKTAISYSAINAGSTSIATLTDGVKTSTSNSYPIWWTATPNANVVFDLGSSQDLVSLAYYGYSVSGAQRANRFAWYGSNTNNGTDWVMLWDASTNVTLQPLLPNGYERTL
jgi:hypothetical protein